MINNDIVDKYKNRPLAIQSFGDNVKIYCSDFIGDSKLVDRLYEVNCHELTLTDDGLSFIQDYYTFDKVVEMIKDSIERGVDFKYSSKDDIIKWLMARGESLN